MFGSGARVATAETPWRVPLSHPVPSCTSVLGCIGLQRIGGGGVADNPKADGTAMLLGRWRMSVQRSG